MGCEHRCNSIPNVMVHDQLEADQPEANQANQLEADQAEADQPDADQPGANQAEADQADAPQDHKSCHDSCHTLMKSCWRSTSSDQRKTVCPAKKRNCEANCNSNFPRQLVIESTTGTLFV